jgi:hypothetical protein
LVDANGEPVKHYGSSFDMKAISADIQALLG